MDELGSKVVRTKVKRIRLYFLLSEVDLFLGVRHDRVKPVTIIPYMEVLLIFHEQVPRELLFHFDDIRVSDKERLDKPLSVAPYCIGFWVRENQLSCQLDLCP